MIHHTIYGICKDYTGKEIIKCETPNTPSLFLNSMISDILSEKYFHKQFHEYRKDLHGDYQIHVVGDMDYKEWVNALNQTIQSSNHTPDQVCWNFFYEQIFHTLDKQLVSDSIFAFIKQNEDIVKDHTNTPLLKQTSVRNELEQIASAIAQLDAALFPYFVFKNANTYETIELLFKKYDKEKQLFVPCPMYENLTKLYTEFVCFQDGKIKKLVGSTDFPYR